MLLFSQRGLGRKHWHEGCVLVQHAVELAVVVVADLAAFGLRGVLRIADFFEGARVRGHRMGRHVQKDERVVGRDLVQLTSGDEFLTVLPDELVPAVALDPFARRSAGDLLLQGVEDGLAAGHAVEIEVEHVLAGPLAVHVALDEAGGEDLAGCVDNVGARANVGLHIGSRSHGDDLAVLGGHAAVLDDGEVRLAFLHLVARDGDGVDLRMLDDQVGLGIPGAHASFLRRCPPRKAGALVSGKKRAPQPKAEALAMRC